MAQYNPVVDMDDDVEANNLEFRDFDAGEENSGSGRGRKGRGPNDLGGFLSSADTTTRDTGKKLLWKLDFYAQYFDVETKQVIERTIGAVFPMRNFLELLDGSPDLYGPFWIPTTVILVLFFSSTIAGYIAANLSEDTYHYNFKILTSAAALIYGYNGIVPIALWLGLKWYRLEPSLLDCLCLYGYSMTVWILVALISISPMEIFNWSTVASIIRWVSVAIGFAISASFLVRNLYPVLSNADAKTSKLLILVIVGLHAALSLAFKFLFFAYSIKKNSSPPGLTPPPDNTVPGIPDDSVANPSPADPEVTPPPALFI